MPTRMVAARELAKFIGVFGHPDRIRIVEELRGAERDVNALQEILGVSHSRTSQNLSILRAHRIVVERRDGRHVYYRLLNQDIAEWVVQGLRFVQADLAEVVQRQMAIEAARQVWTPKDREPSQPGRPEPGSEGRPGTSRKRQPKSSV
ncbi:MAG: ArsR/SmtB family transcription factor [Vicinamibacterales bacterium]